MTSRGHGRGVAGTRGRGRVSPTTEKSVTRGRLNMEEGKDTASDRLTGVTTVRIDIFLLSAASSADRLPGGSSWTAPPVSGQSVEISVADVITDRTWLVSSRQEGPG